MKFSATIYGCVADKKTYAAIKVTGDKFAHSRVLKLNKGTANQAELVALNYALSAVKPEFKNEEFEVATSNAYVLQMTGKNEQGAFKVSPEKNIELVQEIRNKLSAMPRVVVVSKKGPALDELKEAVKAYKK